ncbi:probable sucrose-phosphatase 2 [Selaginella moellendorffii]|uniref:probable sucrose-phosphatase 2 n=1 Tax=Selaginella moellendorffii TaxID=88036 RepID=UPI000D1D0C47|nr:probable sucrose-phosphatase 2 [Selaginella moellendorffii]|eukprot:XP_024528757.1 probable sucrose-phosphatase 2 [Selaginella moellendorffii]
MAVAALGASLWLPPQEFSSFPLWIDRRQGPCFPRIRALAARKNANAAASSPSVMLVSDLDFTMVDHKDQTHSSLLDFASLWEAEYSRDCHLVFSSGRSPEKYLDLRRQVPLLTPDTIICSVGTEIRYGPSMTPDNGWEEHLDEGWNREIIVEEAKKFATLQFQEDSEQRPHKVSFKVEKKDAEEIIRRFSKKFKELKLDAKLIYSGGIDLDVLPQRAGKGEALAYLMKKANSEGWAKERVLVCGDSGNDVELFTVKGVNGVIVGNAFEELVKWYSSQSSKDHIHFASNRCAGGIIEALKFFDMGPALPPRERPGGNSNGAASPRREIVDFYIFFDKWVKGDIPNTDEAFQRLTSVIAEDARMVYPWGEELNLLQSLAVVRGQHGAFQGKELRTWVDSIQEQELAPGVYLATWQSWEQPSGENRKGYYATAVFKDKEGAPNGVEWLRVHQTPQKQK